MTTVPTFEPPKMTLRYGSGSEASEAERRSMADVRLSVSQIPTFDDVLAQYPSFADAATCFAAGSVVRGWAHANSDVDLYVVLPDRPAIDPRFEYFERNISTADPTIYIVLGEFGAFRADIEVWTAAQVDEIIGRFSGAIRDQESPDVEKSEQDMLYRLSTAKCLSGEGWWQERKTRIQQSSYGLWIAEKRKLSAEGYLEDTAGLLVSDDAHTAVLAAYEAFNLALESILAISGDLCITRKWLYKRLSEVRPPEIDPAEAWSRLTMQGAHDGPAEWALATARRAQDLLIAVEQHGLAR